MTRRSRLPKCLAVYIKPLPWGHVAEWLRNGLQSNEFAEYFLGQILKNDRFCPLLSRCFLAISEL